MGSCTLITSINWWRRWRRSCCLLFRQNNTHLLWILNELRLKDADWWLMHLICIIWNSLDLSYLVRTHQVSDRSTTEQQYDLIVWYVWFVCVDCASFSLTNHFISFNHFPPLKPLFSVKMFAHFYLIFHYIKKHIDDWKESNIVPDWLCMQWTKFETVFRLKDPSEPQAPHSIAAVLSSGEQNNTTQNNAQHSARENNV